MIPGSFGILLYWMLDFRAALAEWRLRQHVNYSDQPVSVLNPPSYTVVTFHRHVVVHSGIHREEDGQLKWLGCRCGLVFYGRPHGSWRAVRVR